MYLSCLREGRSDLSCEKHGLPCRLSAFVHFKCWQSNFNGWEATIPGVFGLCSSKPSWLFLSQANTSCVEIVNMGGEESKRQYMLDEPQSNFWMNKVNTRTPMYIHEGFNVPFLCKTNKKKQWLFFFTFYKVCEWMCSIHSCDKFTLTFALSLWLFILHLNTVG